MTTAGTTRRTGWGGKRIIKLHPFWDDLLGKGVTLSSVEKGAREAQEAVGANRAEVTREEQANPSIESWIKESFGLAVAYAYVKGKVIPAVAERRREPSVLATEADPRITVANRTGQQT